MGTEKDGSITGVELLPLRIGENGVEGSVAKIESIVKLPESRIPSSPETGTESSSGDTVSEWNIDEQDEMLASAMCSEWVDEELTEDEESAGFTKKQTLSLGDVKKVWHMVKKYPQAPVEYRHFVGLQLNQLAISMPLNDMVRMTWSWLGSNHPEYTTTDPAAVSGFTYGTALTTKAFKTLKGYFKYGETESTMTALRQAPLFELTINNNKEVTDALFETEAIEMSDGDFVVTGSFDIWKADATAMNIANSGIRGEERFIEVQVNRTVGNINTAYTIKLKVKLDNATESKDGNKLKNTVPFTLDSADGIKFIKTVQTIS